MVNSIWLTFELLSLIIVHNFVLFLNQMKCASQGGHLVIIDAAHENSFVRQYLAEYRGKRLDFFATN